MPDEIPASPLAREQFDALWAEHDRLRKEIGRLQQRFDQVNDQLMADLLARTGFPREKSA